VKSRDRRFGSLGDAVQFDAFAKDGDNESGVGKQQPTTGQKFGLIRVRRIHHFVDVPAAQISQFVLGHAPSETVGMLCRFLCLEADETRGL